MSLKLSVIVPHYGSPSSTNALLKMLDLQQGDLDLQVIVVDDSSPVAFPATVEVEVTRRAVNGGFGSAVNSGVERVAHDHVLVLNSDVEIEPTFITELLAAAGPWQPALISPRVTDARGEDEWVGRRFPTVTQQSVEWLTPLARFRDRPAWHRRVGHDVASHGGTAVVDWVIGAAMLIPTEEFRAVGGFDERFFMNVEEVDLQRRLAARGVRSVVLAEPSLVHAGGGSSDPQHRRRWLVASRLRYAEKWGGLGRLRAALTVSTAINFTVNGARRMAGREIAPISVARRELSLIWRQA